MNLAAERPRRRARCAHPPLLSALSRLQIVIQKNPGVYGVMAGRVCRHYLEGATNQAEGADPPMEPDRSYARLRQSMQAAFGIQIRMTPLPGAARRRAAPRGRPGPLTPPALGLQFEGDWKKAPAGYLVRSRP